MDESASVVVHAQGIGALINGLLGLNKKRQREVAKRCYEFSGRSRPDELNIKSGDQKCDGHCDAKRKQEFPSFRQPCSRCACWTENVCQQRLSAIPSHDELAYRPVRPLQRGFLRQEDDADVARARLLSKSAAVNHQHMLFQEQRLHEI